MRSRESYENELRRAREAKRKRTGTCRCGAVTRYAGKPGTPVSELCRKCAAEERGERARGTGEVNRRVLLYLRKPRRYMDIAKHVDIPQNQMGMTLSRLLKYGLIERVERGVYQRVER